MSSTFNIIAGLRGLNTRLQSLFLTTLFFRMGTMGFPFFPIFLIQNKMLSPSQAGLLAGTFGAGALLCDLFIGKFIKLFSPGRIIFFSLLSSAIILAMIPFLNSYFSFLIVSLLWGVSYESFTPSAYSETILYSDVATRKIAFSYNRLAINIGMAIGPFAGSFIFIAAPSLVFIINAAFSLFSLFFFVLSGRKNEIIIRDKEKIDEISQREKNTCSACDQKYHFTRLVFILTAAIPVHIAYALPATFLPTYLLNYTSYPGYLVGWLFFINALLIILFEVPVNKKMSLINSRKSLIIGLLLSGLGFSLMSAEGQMIILIMATVLWSMGEMIIFPSFPHYISGISAKENIARNMGLYSAGVNIGVMITPSLAFLFLNKTYLPSPWLSTGVVLLITFMLLIFIKNKETIWKEEA